VNAILVPHIAAGIIAVLAGFLAVAVRKGGPLHRLAGTWFFGSMLVLGVTASILEPFRTPEPGSPVGGMIVCYFVATSWMTARRRDGRPGWFEKLACAAVLGLGVLVIIAGLNGATPQPGAALAVGAVCLLAGLLDLNFILRGKLSGAQRIARHVWRMCFAFFIATGSFFLGQQDILPKAVQGTPILFVLAFAPLAIMLFWLVRLRFAKMVGKLSLRLPHAPAANASS
jgi:FtsH-binding integral membrane protein